MLWFEQRLELWRWLIPLGCVVAQICKGLNLRSRHPRITFATTCPVWNDLPNSLEYYRLCVLLGGVEIGIVFHPAHMVQEGPVGETLALQAGPVGETVAKHNILL
jgi:hypothetical protein